MAVYYDFSGKPRSAPAHSRPSSRSRPRRTKKRIPLLFPILLLLLAGVGFTFHAHTLQDTTTGSPGLGLLHDTLLNSSGNNLKDIPIPDWITQDILPRNPYSRPGDALPQVNGVVVHYVGNPGTTARQNRSYFGNLAETGETYASSHFLVGMEGEIIQCVPLGEISYCSSQRNADTIAIECCHPGEDGAFTEETVTSLVRLLDWLIDIYGLEREDILRHYDVTGKECPRWYVRNPDAWDQLLDQLTFPSGT